MASPLSLSLPPPNLPRLEKDQTLYSWCGEVHRWNGNPLGVDTSLQLFGSPRAGFFHDFPSSLGTLVQRTDGALGDARTLALQHTVLGYYLPFVEARRAEEILAGVTFGTVARLKFHLALPKSGLGASHPLKGCDKCFDAQETARTHAYWRTKHQWPSAVVCCDHGTPLKLALDTHTPIHRRDWLLPRSGPPREWIEFPALSDAALEIAQRLAKLSAALARREAASLPEGSLRVAYRAGMRSVGLARQDGTFDVPRLSKTIRQRYASLRALPGMGSLVSGPDALSRALDAGLSGSSLQLHPVKHLILIDMLFKGWSAFEDALRGSADAEETLVFQPSVDPRLAEFKALVAGGKSVSAAARALGVTPTTGVRWAKLVGVAFTPRTKSLSETTLENARRLLAEGLDKAEVVAKTGISLVSLNRLISSEPAVGTAWTEARTAADRESHRKRFLKLLQQNPSLPVSEIRKKPGNGFHWLYRNDREWLAEHLPAIWQPPTSPKGS